MVGRAVTRAAGVLPRVVRKASGLEEPSPEAVTAGVVRGVTALAPLFVPVGGRAVELAGIGGVLALATWTFEAELDDVSSSNAIDDAIADIERRRLCGPRTALVWRAAASASLGRVTFQARRRAFVPDARKLGRSAVWSLTRKVAVHAFGAETPLRILDAGLTFAGAWTAMGDAARLVDATRQIAGQLAARQAAARVWTSTSERSPMLGAGASDRPVS
jgi:hypothetical protein